MFILHRELANDQLIVSPDLNYSNWWGVCNRSVTWSVQSMWNFKVVYRPDIAKLTESSDFKWGYQLAEVHGSCRSLGNCLDNDHLFFTSWRDVEMGGCWPAGRQTLRERTTNNEVWLVLCLVLNTDPSAHKWEGLSTKHHHTSFTVISISVSVSFPYQFHCHFHVSFSLIPIPVSMSVSVSFPYQFHCHFHISLILRPSKLKCWRLTQKHESHISYVQCHWRGAIHVWRCWAGGCLHMCWGAVQFPHWYIHIAACLIASAIYVALWDFTSIVHFTLRAHRFPYMVEARDVWDPP